MVFKIPFFYYFKDYLENEFNFVGLNLFSNFKSKMHKLVVTHHLQEIMNYFIKIKDLLGQYFQASLFGKGLYYLVNCKVVVVG